MIPRDDQFDVFVIEGVLVEVWHGERVSVAQQFAVDWDGPLHSVVHASVFCPPATALAVPLDDPLPWVPWCVRVWRAVRWLGCAWLVWGVGVGAVIAWGLAHKWW